MLYGIVYIYTYKYIWMSCCEINLHEWLKSIIRTLPFSPYFSYSWHPAKRVNKNVYFSGVFPTTKALKNKLLLLGLDEAMFISLKIGLTLPQKERIIFQASIFRSKLLVLQSLIVNPTILNFLLILSFGVNGKSVKFGCNGKCFFFVWGGGKRSFLKQKSLMNAIYPHIYIYIYIHNNYIVKIFNIYIHLCIHTYELIIKSPPRLKYTNPCGP